MKFLFFIATLFMSTYSISGEFEELKNYWWNSVVEYCQGYPSKENCDDGDSVLFNALLCASGEELGCETVRNSQDDDGRWWRSPRRKSGNLGRPNSFSKDQGMGVLLYLATTKDVDAATRWLNWIKVNRACAVWNPFNSKVCSIRGPYRLCRDDESKQCTITPTFWSNMGTVWRYLGMPRKSEMKEYEGIEYSETELVAARYAKPGYRLHLKGVQTYLKKITGHSISNDMVLNIILDRQPDNPFYKLLKYGPTQDIKNQVIAQCPRFNSDLSFRRHQWTWERATSDEAWRESMGWDCIFISNLFEQLRI